MTTITSTTTSTTGVTPELKPMGWGLSLAYFGVPALIFIGLYHGVMPLLARTRLPAFYAYALPVGLGLFGLLVAALIAYVREGHPLNWGALRARFRYHGMNWKTWLLVIGVWLVIGGLVMGVLTPAMNQLLLWSGLGIPGHVPPFDNPSLAPEQLPAVFDAAFGGLRGNWFALAVYFVLLCFNIVGEELWWRGYILPRQELAFGRWTWLIHGTLWALFHVFKWWQVPVLLPVTLVTAFVSVRLKNNAPAFWMHWFFNGTGLLGALALVLGLA